MSYTPIIITGPGRSGTTALCKLLNTSPKVRITNELAQWHFWDEANPERSRDIMSRGMNVKIRDDVFRDFDNDAYELTGKDINEIMSSTSMFVGDKYPVYLNTLDDIFLVTPNAKVIVTYRDPRCIYDSFMRKSSIENPPPWATGIARDADWYAKSQCTMLILALNKHREKILKIPFEWSINHPYMKINAIEDYLELNRGDLMIDYNEFDYKPINTSPEGRDYSFELLQLAHMLGYKVA